MGKRGNAEGSIHKRRDDRWAATIHLGYENGKRKRRTFYSSTRQGLSRTWPPRNGPSMEGCPSPPRLSPSLRFSGTGSMSLRAHRSGQEPFSRTG